MLPPDHSPEKRRRIRRYGLAGMMLLLLVGALVAYPSIRRANSRAHFAYTHTPLLIRAAERGDIAEVQRLVRRGVNPANADDTDEDYRTAAEIAICRKDLAMVRYLVEHGAGQYNPRTGDDYLNIAAGAGSPEILAYLMRRYPDHDKGRLLYYAAGGNYARYFRGGYTVENVQYLLAHGAQSAINKPFNSGERALHRAANAEIAACLLAHGAQLNARDRFDHTPLHFAASQWDFKLVKFYVDHGLDVNARSKGGESILMAATVVRNPEVIAYLKAHGAKW